METSAELLYLLKFADKKDTYGFKDELERNQCLQWLFFAHGSMAPYQGKQSASHSGMERVLQAHPNPSKTF
jgi:glutathione S-transferase